MFQTLRIIFTLLSALCVALVLPVGAFAGLTYALICVALAFVFFVIMLYFKSKQEQSNPDDAPTPDFMKSEPNPDGKTTNNDE